MVAYSITTRSTTSTAWVARSEVRCADRISRPLTTVSAGERFASIEDHGSRACCSASGWHHTDRRCRPATGRRAWCTSLGVGIWDLGGRGRVCDCPGKASLSDGRNLELAERRLRSGGAPSSAAYVAALDPTHFAFIDTDVVQHSSCFQNSNNLLQMVPPPRRGPRAGRHCGQAELID